MADNRKKILDLVLEAEDHPTADDIFQELREEGQRVSLATVYNNLNSLCEEGKIRPITFNGKTVHYDKPVCHAHLLCKNCGKVKDLQIDRLQEKLEADCGFALEGYDLKLIYICPDCRAKAEQSHGGGDM